MAKDDIPVVIIHRTYKDYLKTNLEITGTKNKIYLIGDKSISHLDIIKNVTFIDISKYEDKPLIKKAKNKFINYSSNSKMFEWVCFERVFILKYFIEEFNLKKVFHIDSDNILLSCINDYNFEKNIAYCINTNFHKYRMSNSIHCGLLNIQFCDEFIRLYKDIYINKSRFNLIEDKISYHTNKNGNFERGGICDMTLYYILANEKIIDVQNLLNIKNNTVFINNINNGEGEDSKTQFKTNENGILDINITKNGECFVYDKIHNQKVKLHNIHFQGGAKRILNSQLKSMLIK